MNKIIFIFISFFLVFDGQAKEISENNKFLNQIHFFCLSPTSFIQEIKYQYLSDDFSAVTIKGEIDPIRNKLKKIAATFRLDTVDLAIINDNLKKISNQLLDPELLEQNLNWANRFHLPLTQNEYQDIIHCLEFSGRLFLEELIKEFEREKGFLLDDRIDKPFQLMIPISGFDSSLKFKFSIVLHLKSNQFISIQKIELHKEGVEMRHYYPVPLWEADNENSIMIGAYFIESEIQKKIFEIESFNSYVDSDILKMSSSSEKITRDNVKEFVTSKVYEKIKEQLKQNWDSFIHDRALYIQFSETNPLGESKYQVRLELVEQENGLIRIRIDKIQIYFNGEYQTYENPIELTYSSLKRPILAKLMAKYENINEMEEGHLAYVDIQQILLSC